MLENSDPIISRITTLVMFLGVMITAMMYGLLGSLFWISWAVCIGVLFLFERRFGRKRRKRFTINAGVFIATAIMGIFFAVSLISFSTIPVPVWSRDNFIPEFNETACYIMFLPPMIVSLLVNIGNIIYKVMSGNADRPSDRQP